MKTIYVWTGDYRSYGFSSELWSGDTLQVEVTDDFSGGGKTYEPDSGIWIPDPLDEPTPEQLVTDAEQKRQMLCVEAESIIAPLTRAVKLGVATEDESSRLAKWEMYTVLLMRVDSARPVWPVTPL